MILFFAIHETNMTRATMTPMVQNQFIRRGKNPTLEF